MAQDIPSGLTPLSLDELDNVIGGAGAHAPQPREHARKDEHSHTAYDAAVAAAAKAAASAVAHVANGLQVTIASANFHIPHPPGGDAAQTLSVASTHLDQVHTEVAQSAGAHAIDNILSGSWTRAG